LTYILTKIKKKQEPHLEPVYQAARSYLEINQRVALLNQRLDVIGDLVSIQFSQKHM